jgi:hypothetical protein
MSEPQVKFVKSQALAINFLAVSAPMTIRAEGDEVLVLMCATSRPRDNVVDIHFDVPTSGDRASMAGFDENAPTESSRHWRTLVPIISKSHPFSSFLPTANDRVYSRPSAAPILFGFAFDCWRIGVLEVQPIARGTRTIAGAEALRHDTFKAELAGVAEHHFPVL